MSTRMIARPANRRERSAASASTSGSSGTRRIYCVGGEPRSFPGRPGKPSLEGQNITHPATVLPVTLPQVGTCARETALVLSVVSRDDAGVSAVAPLPMGAEFFLDARGGARSLRVRWHHSEGLVVLSLWRGDEC